MKETYNTFFTWEWWISVVVVGIVINLISAYLKTPVDYLFSQLSSRWEKRTAQKREEFNALIEHLRDDDVAQLDARFDLLRDRMISLQDSVLAVGLYILGIWSSINDRFTELSARIFGELPPTGSFYPIFFIMGIYYTQLGINAAFRMKRLSEALREARKLTTKKVVSNLLS